MKVTPELSLYRSFRTTCEMMKDRKYEVQPDLLELDFESFCDAYLSEYTLPLSITDLREVRESLTLVFNKGKRSVIVFWIETCGTADIQRTIRKMSHPSSDGGGEKITHSIIIIGTNKITTTAANALRLLPTCGVVIETFNESSLQYNITRHIYQPKFIVCSKVTKKKILEAYAVTESQLPKMVSSDPVAKYYHAKPGTLMKILRPSESMPYVMLPDGTKKGTI